MSTLDEQISSWTHAEQAGDADRLETLLHPQFLAVGPYGFVLDREQWKARFSHGLHYDRFAFHPDTETRIIDRTALVVGTQTQQGQHQGHPVEGTLRATIVLTDEPSWRILGLHLSLGAPPNDGTGPNPHPTAAGQPQTNQPTEGPPNAPNDLAHRMRRRAKLMGIVNIPMRKILGLPFPTPLGGRLMLVTLTGRRTGKTYHQPVSYVRDGNTLLTPGGGKWKLNLQSGRAETIRLGGRDITAWPEIVHDAHEIDRLLTVMTAATPSVARFIPIPRDTDGRLDHDKLNAAISNGFSIIRWAPRRLRPRAHQRSTARLQIIARFAKTPRPTGTPRTSPSLPNTLATPT
jgi:hypothetical protein